MNELLKQLADIDSQIDALLSHDELDDTSRAEHAKLVAERAKVTGKIDRERDRQAREEERERLADDEEKRKRTVAAPVVAGTNRLAKPDTPALPIKVPATVEEKVITLANGAKVSREWLADPARGFDSHVDYFKAVIDAGTGERFDPRLKPLAAINRREDADNQSQARGSDYILPAAFTPAGMTITSFHNSRGKQITAGSDEQGTYSDPYGGFLANRKSYRNDLLKLMPEDDPMGALTTKIPMETASVSIPARTDKNHTTSVSGGLRVYRRSETQAVTASRMEIEEVELKATPLMGVAYATEELLARSPMSFIALIRAGFSDEFSSKLIRERLEGTGAGQFEGVLNTPCIISVTAESGQSPDTIILDNIYKMRARCWKYSRAIWTANHDTLPQLATLNAVVGTGGVPFWQPSAREDHPDMLMGRPLYFTEFQPTVGDTGDILLGVWSEYLEGQLSPMQDAESIHVRFLEHERALKMWTETAGRCWWRAPLTPAKSASTLSPFVKLAAR